MFEQISQTLSGPLLNENINIFSILIGFTLAAILSFFISLIYKRLNRGRENIHFMMQSLIVLSMTIAAAMMIVGNELARAFGLVGAVSVIRFRTAVQNYRDMAFVFIAIVIGMACGLQFYILAGIIGMSTGILLLILGVIGFGKEITHKHYLLRINFSKNGITRQNLEKELASTVSSFQFTGMKTNDRRSWMEYRIQVRNQGNIDNLITNLTEKYAENKVVVRILLVLK
ncbi:MAG: DUF4956 domain-containing protein [Spirochaetales bacterium]|nr:DUF4956 domain-containing protein [Spirochaetales bacterium]